VAFDTAKYLKKYREETFERLESAERALINHEKSPDKASLFRGIKREVHTLKGSSKMLGFETINELAHSLEDFFEDVSRGTKELNDDRIDLILSLFDVLREGSEWIVTHGDDTSFDGTQGKTLLKELNQAEVKAESGPGNHVPLESTIHNTSSFSLSKNDLFSQLGLTPPPSEEKPADSPDVLKTDPSPPNDKTEIPIMENPPQQPKNVDQPAGKNNTGPSLKKIVTGKMNERVFQHKVKVDAEVIDQLTHYSMETTFHIMHFENILQRYKTQGMKLKNVLSRLGNSPTPELANLSHMEHGYSELFLDFQKTYDQFNTLLSKLTDSVLATKLIPLSNIFNTFPRYVRDLSRELSKKVVLKIEGQETKLDKNILACLNEALIHIIRNAIDHGIETKEERTRKQKEEQATLSLSAFNQGNRVVIVIRDDGQGIDLEKVKKKALEKKLVLPEKVDQLSSRDLLDFIFLSGFSTSEMTTDISGRGVGMDVVRKNINKYHGQIEVETESGLFTEFRIILPMAMSTSQLLFVEIAGRKYGLPLEFLSSVHPLKNTNIMLHKRKLSLIEQGEILEVVDIGQYLGIRNELNPLEDSFLLSTTLNEHVLLLVDRVLGQKDQIVKKYDDFLGKPMFSSGATQLEDGQTIIVLDVFDLINYRGLESQMRTMGVSKTEKKNRILLVDDSAMTREIEAGILESAGYDVTTAVDGMDAFEQLSLNSDFDLIVTDVEMPNMDGFELTEKIRKTPVLSALPVVMVTSLSKSSERLRGLEAGANAYLTKQALAKGSLLQTVRQFMGGE